MFFLGVFFEFNGTNGSHLADISIIGDMDGRIFKAELLLLKLPFRGWKQECHSGQVTAFIELLKQRSTFIISSEFNPRLLLSSDASQC
jgi:hypothetical protein